MIVSKILRNIDGKKVAYYNLHAEECLINPGAFYMNSIGSSIENISMDIMKDEQNDVFVLDFQKKILTSINFLDKLFDWHKSNTNKILILTNVPEQAISQSKFSGSKDLNQDNLANEIYTCFIDSIFDKDNNTLKLPDLNCKKLKLQDLFETELLEKLKKYTKQNPPETRYHESSSVYLPTYINIKELMTKDKPFFLYTVYQLASQMQNDKKFSNYFSQKGDEKPILICQSLNGSCIASVLAGLLNTGIFVFEQIGPINRLNRNIGHIIESDKKYIIVSDVVCLGTEVKIAKSIIKYFGGKCLGNVSIVQYKNESTTKEGVSTFTITKDNCDDLNFSILTGLNINEDGK